MIDEIIARKLVELQADRTKQLVNDLGKRYSGTLRNFRKTSPGRVYTSLWACLRAYAKYHGVYPRDFLPRLYTFLEVQPDWRICHLFAGTVRPIYPNEIRVDLNPAVKPDFLEDATCCSVPDVSQHLTISDPPYDEKNAAIYGYPFPSPKAVLLEAARVTMVGGYYCVLGWAPLPRSWTGDLRVGIIAITEGALMRTRTLNIFQRVKGPSGP